MSQVIVQSGGYTYKHDSPASAGDLWQGIYNKQLVVVADVFDSGYIDFQPLDTELKRETWHASQFYSTFEKCKEF